MHLTVCLLCGPTSIPSRGGVFQRIFPWLITLCQPVLSQRGKTWLNLPSMTPRNLWTARRKAEPATDRRRLKKNWIQRWLRWCVAYCALHWRTPVWFLFLFTTPSIISDSELTLFQNYEQKWLQIPETQLRHHWLAPKWSRIIPLSHSALPLSYPTIP